MSTHGQHNPRGIFDRSVKGTSVEAITVPVERGRIQFFADVLGESDPIHFDVAAARAAGHPDIVAPPSFFVAIEAAANVERKRRGLRTAVDLIGCDFRYLLHGEERYFYDAPIYAGDEVEIGTTIADFYDKKGGDMEFAVMASTIAHSRRGTLVRSERSLLHRLPPGA